MPNLVRPVRIELVQDLQQGCVGLYHCGEGFIEVLSPAALREIRKQDGAFSHLPVDAYFESIIIHELVHAATENMPCPFDDCVAAKEYVAYVMQIMSLMPDARKEFEEVSGIDRSVSADELSLLMLLMVPELFAQKVWAHFSQRDAPCDFVEQLLKAEILIDREHFHGE